MPRVSPFLKKLSNGYIWKRIFYERLTEPIHLNALSLVVALVGPFRLKVAFDLVLRAHTAYSMLKAADLARSLGVGRVSAIEFGVAAGAGLLNMCAIGTRVTQATGVAFDIYGFDTATGMPLPESYKDHPELYQAGDFPMDIEALQQRLPPNARLIIGPIKETIPSFLASVESDSPIGFVAIDVDYYSSTRDALRVFNGSATSYLPRVLIYLDDVEHESHNRFTGELAAIHEFNDENAIRKIDRHAFLRGYRIFRNARWIDHMFTLHVFDHATRSTLRQPRDKVVLTNPYVR